MNALGRDNASGPTLMLRGESERERVLATGSWRQTATDSYILTHTKKIHVKRAKSDGKKVNKKREK